VNDADKKEFSLELRNLGALYGKPVSAELRLLYWDVLRVLTIDEFRRSVAAVKRTSTWFPRPSEIIKSAKTVGWI